MSYEQAYDTTKSQAEQALLTVKVFSEFKTYFEGKAVSVTSKNPTGPFDILPGHANFITLLNEGNLKISRPNGEQFQTPIERGVMHVNSDFVTVFLGV